ncbi:hypothetical protein BCR36DRAFT_289007, partial [Piromyces finnis]
LSKGNTIFGRYWNLPLNDLYHITKLPGAKDDISSSFFNGYYLIMNKNIDEEHKKATGKVIDFILSKKTQLKYLNKFMKYSGMSELYNSEECNELYCNVFKSLQFVKNEKDIIKRYNECNNQIKNYINEYIYGNSNTAEDTLKHIDYIYTIYDIAYDSSEIIIKKSIFKEPSIKRVSRSRSKRKTFKDKILELHYSSNNIVRYDIDNTNTTTVNNNNNNNNNKLGTEIVLYTNLISSDQVTDISVDSESK